MINPLTMLQAKTMQNDKLIINHKIVIKVGAFSRIFITFLLLLFINKCKE